MNPVAVPVFFLIIAAVNLSAIADMMHKKVGFPLRIIKWHPMPQPAKSCPRPRTVLIRGIWRCCMKLIAACKLGAHTLLNQTASLPVCVGSCHKTAPPYADVIRISQPAIGLKQIIKTIRRHIDHRGAFWSVDWRIRLSARDTLPQIFLISVHRQPCRRI